MPTLKYYQKRNKSGTSAQNTEPEKKSAQQMQLSKDISSNIGLIINLMGNASDILVREFTTSPCIEIRLSLILIEGLAERELINEQIIGTLMSNERFGNIQNNIEFFNTIKQYGIPNIYLREETDIEKVANELIVGNTILLIDQIDKVLIIGSQGWKDRSVSEPVTENVVRGPRDGFTETIGDNIALIRRRIKSSNLRVESLNIGTETKTKISIVYLEGTAREEIISEVRKRLSRININGILESGYIEELIEDNPMSPFPQVEHSERPDKVSAALL